MNGTDFEGINPLDKDASARKMNYWVSDKTNGFIKEIVTPASISPDHRMFLISTVYMRASWTVEAFTSTKHGLFCFKKDSIADCAKDFKWIMLNNVNLYYSKIDANGIPVNIYEVPFFKNRGSKHQLSLEIWKPVDD